MHVRVSLGVRSRVGVHAEGKQCASLGVERNMVEDKGRLIRGSR